MTVHSIRKRFIYTAFANLIRSIISFFTGILLARWLGIGTMRLTTAARQLKNGSHVRNAVSI